jgi:hypothetical protein
MRTTRAAVKLFCFITMNWLVLVMNLIKLIKPSISFIKFNIILPANLLQLINIFVRH